MPIRTLPLPTSTERDIERFWSKVDRTPGQGPKGECWTWTGTRLPKGYGVLAIRRKDRGAYQYVATRVAWMIAHGRDPGNDLMRHNCNYPPCIRPEHLLTGSPANNSEGMVREERQSRGEQHWRAKFRDSDIPKIRQVYCDDKKLSCAELAKRYGVESENIRLIATGASYSHLSGPISADNRERRQGENHAIAKLTNEQVREIRRLDAAGVPRKRLAISFGVSHGNVGAICRRTAWRHVE